MQQNHRICNVEKTVQQKLMRLKDMALHHFVYKKCCSINRSHVQNQFYNIITLYMAVNGLNM